MREGYRRRDLGPCAARDGGRGGRKRERAVYSGLDAVCSDKVYSDLDAVYSDLVYSDPDAAYSDLVYSDLDAVRSDLVYSDLDAVYSNLDAVCSDLDQVPRIGHEVGGSGPGGWRCWWGW